MSMRLAWNAVGGLIVAFGLFVCMPSTNIAADDVATLVGPATEKRFPPLTVPKGFRATLFACDPLVEYPSVIAIGPKQGTLYVAYDYVTGLGVEIVRRDEVRLISDTNGDGYADKSHLYAGGFNSIQGLAYHAGSVFVMHAPLLTALRDTDGDGVADERRDLFTGLGLPPEENSNRLHCANGVVVGHDGWLYLALGDRGCDVRRPEGDRLLFRAGGILRCRVDGRDLHVFATGLRNIYDVALDEELNVFVRDNENDGGDYMICVCHSFHGADHGYPYLYRERPAEAMLPLADLGRGSSAGGTSYLEHSFPKEFRESLYFCEWGRAVVRYGKKRSASSFRLMQEVDFAAGAAGDPYGFKPTDLVVDYDGSLLISDWCDGQRPKRGRGRIYRISVKPSGNTATTLNIISKKDSVKQLIESLNSTSYHRRFAAQDALLARGAEGLTAVTKSIKSNRVNAVGRLHAVWIIAHAGADSAVDNLFQIAKSDRDPRVRAQAVRALADLTDPMLVKHRLTAGRGDVRIAQRLAGLAEEADARVVLEVLVALGRLRWSGAPAWLSQHGKWDDSALEQAAMQLLRRSDNWPAVLALLDERGATGTASVKLRTLVLQAMADRADETVVDGVLERLRMESAPDRRREYVDLLTRVYKKPAAWVYWGFRPAPRPANPVAWERTATIGNALDRALADTDHAVRTFALQRMRREALPVRLAALSGWLKAEKNPDHVAAILAAIKDHPSADIRSLLIETVLSKPRTDKNRLAAFNLLLAGMNDKSAGKLLDLAEQVEDGPVLATVIEELGGRPQISANRLLLKKLDSDKPEVRAAALHALGRRKVRETAPRIASLLDDRDLRVRRAAAAVAGELGVRSAAASLLKSAADSDLELRRASLISLRQLNEPKAVSMAVEALFQSETQLAGLNYLAEFGSPLQISPVTKVAATSRSVDVLTAVVRVLANWREQAASTNRTAIERALADVQGASGLPLLWSTVGPITEDEARAILKKMTDADKSHLLSSSPWSRQFSNGTDAVLNLKSGTGNSSGTAWLAAIDVAAATGVQAEFLASAAGTLQVWLNGQPAFTRQKSTPFRPNSDRFEAKLVKGTNRLLVQVKSDAKNPRFHLRFRPKSSKAEHERLIQLVLKGGGNVERGREVFFNAEKSLCVKCHRIGERGGRIGPDMTGIGSRFSRIHLIESLLDPSKTVAPSYGTITIVLESGKVLTGVKLSETKETLTLGTQEGKTLSVSRSEIEELNVSKRSTMPDGVEKRISDREITDLIAFLISQKKKTLKK